MSAKLPEGDRRAHAQLLFDRALQMPPGGVMQNPRQKKYEMPVLWDFDLYRTRDGWALYWHEPREDSLGLNIPDAAHLLRACLNDFEGTDWNALTIGSQEVS